MKKGQKKELPVIKIISTKDVEMVEMRMEMADEVYADLVRYGREVVTDQQLFEVGFRAALEDGLRGKKKFD